MIRVQQEVNKISKKILEDPGSVEILVDSHPPFLPQSPELP
jgi:hypothetical protein